jgi:hypothetical protein
MRSFGIFVLFLMALVRSVLAEDQAEGVFVADPQIQQIAEAYALDAIDIAKNQFGLKLDRTDESIANVEAILALIHDSYVATNPKPSEEMVMSYAKAFGSYTGEVYRLNHGAEWGMLTLNGRRFPAMKAKSGINFWPWGRALNRIVQGPENNLADYYKMLRK